MQDLRLAIRVLRATPIVTAVAILSLTLGIGANTAIFSLVNSLLLRMLPIEEPQRLVTVSERSPLSYLPVYSYRVFDQIRQHGSSFDGALAYWADKSNLTIGGETQTVDRLLVSGDFFGTLGVPALLGRTLTPADDVPGGGANGPVVVISYKLWRQRLGGVAGVVGTSLMIEQIPVTIVGVTRPEFFGVEVGRTFDIALPIRTLSVISPNFGFSAEAVFLSIMLRLRVGQSLGAGTAALRAVQPQIRADALPRWVQASEFLKEPFTLESAGAGTSALRQRLQRPLVTIFVVVALVLLIACANIANLLVARGIARRHELSVRLALGASRWRLARQLLIESVVLAAIGAILGLVFATWASRALVEQLSTSVTPVVLDLSIDWRVLAFTTTAMVVTAMLFGMAPALRATRVAWFNRQRARRPVERPHCRAGRPVAGAHCRRGPLCSDVRAARAGVPRIRSRSRSRDHGDRDDNPRGRPQLVLPSTG
jgi:putative ABC transport system permease protein